MQGMGKCVILFVSKEDMFSTTLNVHSYDLDEEVGTCQVGECAKEVVQRLAQGRQNSAMWVTKADDIDIERLVEPEYVFCANDTCSIATLPNVSRYANMTVPWLKWAMLYGYELHKDLLVYACKIGRRKMVQYLIEHNCPIATVP